MLCLAAFVELAMRILKCQAGRMDENDDHDPLESETLDSYHTATQDRMLFSHEQIIAYYKHDIPVVPHKAVAEVSKIESL